jgi:hypothetical protein
MEKMDVAIVRDGLIPIAGGCDAIGNACYILNRKPST